MAALSDADLASIDRIGAVPTILRVIGQATGLRLTLVARVTEDTWKACAVDDRMNFGLQRGDLLDIATTLCSTVRVSKQPVIIDQASQDPDYKDHPTPKMYGFESYISVPIFLPDGSYFGNVCALDSLPAKLKDTEARATMELYAELIGLQLAAEQRDAQVRAALLDANQTAELREQFIAVLGHDMRTPLGAISTGAELLLRRNLGPSEHKVVERMRGSAARMTRLVDDLLDFARGRLGGGIPLASAPIDDMPALFRQVVDELRAAHPERAIELQVDSARTFHGDRGRLGQLLSNLLGNALQHGSTEKPVRVEVIHDVDKLSLVVRNAGAPIPQHVQSKLFQPFFRANSGEANAGLGLGLYIVSEIVSSHGGRIEVRSTSDGTAFICSLPTAPA